MDQHRRPGVLRAPGRDGLGGDPLVGRAEARPQHEGASGLPLHVTAEVLVGDEEHLPVGGQALHDLDGVGRGAADVALRLHLGGAVDVADDQRPGMLLLPGAELRAVDHVGHGAAGAQVGQQHQSSRAEDRGGLGHEGHAAEHDDLGRRPRGPACQLQRVAGVVGDPLDLLPLVVVGQDHRVPLLLQLGDAFDQGVPCCLAHPRRSVVQMPAPLWKTSSR